MTRTEETEAGPRATVDADLRGFDHVRAAIEPAKTIVLCAHTRPDGDAIGSVLGLAGALRQRWPEKAVTCLLADDDPVPRIYRFLPGSECFVAASAYRGDPDLFIALDLPTDTRLANAKAVLDRSRAVAVIDHHPSDGSFGTCGCVRTTAAATGVLVCKFALFLGVAITPAMANQLFCALVTDTGRFQYQNADAECFRIASLLVDAGADPAWISLNVYQNFRLAYLRLEGRVMQRIRTLFGDQVSYSYATRADLELTGARDEECDGLIDQVRSVEGVEVALFLKEGKTPGVVRGNLRAKGSVDVSAIARAVGGGGHRAAAGFSIEGTIDDAFEMVMPLIEQALAEQAEASKDDGK
ncbi:bifunctional oligoribonuclease/PAP phosphatase NrnA [Olsenella sp. YH-ols2217]|uniref:Bifunctional oligoribonuclease/PAP phosphatase NrnA n=1 Tax=Kribbibacterium absianum TaxID=3044210 RepID=A0ABT6ZJN4_9ACTN|nr:MULTISPECIES: bifunctional oligoribonuclease/PAP phosphatase NrnA [unclassified Olsenella]MDJ1121371.1 bifunctional oligoribonuclease/PAP phosphatase NrnA [Olsenella sp. YH-ols2216]MDJ1128861.1 bifunctional oligoribonuclease/PAP phosphatase NrnA [Olsenella sp. YH-ols2217]